VSGLLLDCLHIIIPQKNLVLPVQVVVHGILEGGGTQTHEIHLYRMKNKIARCVFNFPGVSRSFRLLTDIGPNASGTKPMSLVLNSMFSILGLSYYSCSPNCCADGISDRCKVEYR
jgi:hypothetical protein